MCESLYKLYRKYPNNHDAIYRQRFNASTTRHFAFPIREHNRREEYPAFLCYTEEFAFLSEEIYAKHEHLLHLLNKVPPLVLKQFILSCVVDEIRATSDIESMYSTRKEIKEVVDGSNHLPFATCEDIQLFYDQFAHKEVVAIDPIHQLDGEPRAIICFLTYM